MRLMTAFSLVFVGLASVASAQPLQSDSQNATVVVSAAAPIFLLPDNARSPLRVAAVGSRLRLIKAEGDWLNVEFRDPQYGARVGYIEKRYTRSPEPELPPTDLSVRESSQPPAVANRDPEPPRVAPPSPDFVPRSPNKNHREGFWFNAGLGEGWLGCDDCGGERLGGASGGLSLGGTISPRVLLGIGTTGWARSVLGETLTVGTLDLRVRFYPSVSSGFFITGGLGGGSISFAGESEFGTGAVVGLGIDLRVGSNVSITPFWNGFAMRSSNLDANVGQIGLGITVH